MRISHLLTILLLLSPLDAMAQRVDVIVTKDGNKYEGYLAKQVPNKSITIVSSRTTMTVAALDAEIYRLREKMVGDLPEEYIALFPLLPDDALVELADISVEDISGHRIMYGNSVILEKGAYLKFVSFDSQSFDLDWAQIKISSKVPYDFSRMVGMRDRIILPDARILDGQMMEQNLQSGIYKFREKSGQVTSFHRSEIQAIRYEPGDPNADIWEQIPYCDKVNLRDGSSVDGFIIAKLFGKTVEILQYNSSITEVIQAKAVESYEKYKNPLFKQKYETPESVERYADLYVNGEARHICSLLHEKKKYTVTNEIDSLKIRVNVGEKVVIKYRTEARTSQFLFAKAKLTKEKVYGLSGLKVKDRGTELLPTFTTSDVVSNPDINFQANGGGYIIADLILESSGVYVFFINDSRQCIVIYAQ